MYLYQNNSSVTQYNLLCSFFKHAVGINADKFRQAVWYETFVTIDHSLVGRSGGHQTVQHQNIVWVEYIFGLVYTVSTAHTTQRKYYTSGISMYRTAHAARRRHDKSLHESRESWPLYCHLYCNSRTCGRRSIGNWSTCKHSDRQTDRRTDAAPAGVYLRCNLCNGDESA